MLLGLFSFSRRYYTRPIESRDRPLIAPQMYASRNEQRTILSTFSRVLTYFYEFNSETRYSGSYLP